MHHSLFVCLFMIQDPDIGKQALLHSFKKSASSATHCSGHSTFQKAGSVSFALSCARAPWGLQNSLQLDTLPRTFFQELLTHTPPVGKEFILTFEVLGDLRAFIGNTQTSCGNGSRRSMEGNPVRKKSMRLPWWRSG